jgi:signal transduction histidine kinase/ActR/RegA family two-component response regulator
MMKDSPGEGVAPSAEQSGRVGDLESKRMLEIYERANRVARVGTWEMNLRTQVLWWSEVTREIHEVPPGFQPQLQDALNYYVEGTSRETITRHFQDAVRRGTPFDLELQIRTAKGKLRWVRSVGQAHCENGEPVLVNGAFQDITEMRTAREKLIEVNRRLEEAVRHSSELAREAQKASRAKGDFLAAMSHEIRTPLNAIIGAIELLHETKLNDQQQELSRLALSSSTLLLSTLNSILDFSRIESGHIHVEPVDFALQEELETILNGMRVVARRKGLTLHLQLGKDLPEFVHADKNLLRQILLNLLGNAVKFTASGKVELEVASKSPPLVDFFVRDTGPGIPAVKLKTIFLPFEQGCDDPASRHPQGTGLGLAIAERLCSCIGGTISVDSHPGCGSVFQVTLPMPPALRAQPGLEGSVANARIPSDIKAVRVLLVEDNDINTTIGRLLLQSLGCREILTAENGEDALQVLEEHEVDVVLMDCFMPVMDGLSTTREIRRREAADPARPRVRIIGLSASTERHCIEEAYAAGMDNYLAKPVKRRKLAAAILQASGD